jgi:hypothetical protein
MVRGQPLCDDRFLLASGNCVFSFGPRPLNRGFNDHRGLDDAGGKHCIAFDRSLPHGPVPLYTTHSLCSGKFSKGPLSENIGGLASDGCHSSLEHHFIRAETIRWDALLEAGSEAAARSKGTLRLEGKEYVVQDGDVMHIRHSG